MPKQEKKLSGMKCGDCLYFKAYPRNGKTCNKDGILEYANAPSSCFVPDISQVASNTEQFIAISSLLNTFSSKQARICIYVLKQNVKRKSKQVLLGSKVYILSGEDYLFNYKAAYLLYYLDQDTAVISGSPRLNVKGRYFIGYVSPKSLLTEKDFLKKKAQLIKQGRIEDPSKNKESNNYSIVDQFEPSVPTIDTVPDEWVSKQDTPKKIKDTYDKLTSI